MNDFRDQASVILDIRILNGTDWKRVFSQLDNEGKPDRRTITRLLELLFSTVDHLTSEVMLLKTDALLSIQEKQDKIDQAQ